MGYTTNRNIVYHQNDHEVHTCDVYLPDSNMTDFPVAIFLHGGSFHTGSKEMYQEWGVFLARNNIVAVAINYTLATPTRPSYDYVLDDLNAAIKFVVSHAAVWRLDPYNIALIGDSAGGYLACMGALKLSGSSFKIKAAIPVYGVFDLAEWDTYTDRMRKDKVVKKFTGTLPSLNAELYHNLNILTMVDRAIHDPHFRTKFLVIFGEVDNVVLAKHQSYRFIKKLEYHKVVHEVICIPDMGHFWFTPINTNQLVRQYPTDQVTKQVLHFLEDVFKDMNTFDIYLYDV